jgi:hypothetical protein
MDNTDLRPDNAFDIREAKSKTVGPDEGIIRVVLTMTGTAGSHGFVGAVWARGEKTFAEARVYPRGDAARPGSATVCVEAAGTELAIALLESKISERFGPLKTVQWLKPDRPDEEG